MTLFYPDVSNYQAGISLAGAKAACVLVTQGTDFSDPDLEAFLAEAKKAGAWPFGYHFLMEGDGAAQARTYFSRAGKLPCMIDTEPTPAGTAESRPSIADVLAFTTELRALGGIVHLCYLPRWYWADAAPEGLGSPPLHPLTQAGLHLVSSDYTTYSESGVGITPSVWQFSSTYLFNGKRIDYNAFRGDLTQLKALVTGSAAAKPQEEEDMNIGSDEAHKTFSWVAGTADGLSLGCGSALTQEFTVLVYYSGSSKPESESLSVTSGRASLTFREKDVFMVYMERKGAADTWDQVWAHTY
jgi:Glycosyl hydrolases family 25